MNEIRVMVGVCVYHHEVLSSNLLEKKFYLHVDTHLCGGKSDGGGEVHVLYVHIWVVVFNVRRMCPNFRLLTFQISQFINKMGK